MDPEEIEFTEVNSFGGKHEEQDEERHKDTLQDQKTYEGGDGVPQDRGVKSSRYIEDGAEGRISISTSYRRHLTVYRFSFPRWR